MTNKLRRLGIPLASIVAVLLCVHASAFGVTIDEFNGDRAILWTNDGSPNFNPVTPVWTRQSLADGTLLGAQRDVYVEVSGTPMPYSAIVSSGQGQLDFATFGSINPPSASMLVLQYDGLDPALIDELNDVKGLAQVDLTEAGTQTGFQLDFSSLDLASSPSMEVRIRVEGVDGASNPVTADQTFDVSTMDFFAPFAMFGPAAAPAFERAESVTFWLNNALGPNIDFTLDSITTAVPEPSTWALLGMMAMVMAGYGYRRRNR